MPLVPITVYYRWFFFLIITWARTSASEETFTVQNAITWQTTNLNRAACDRILGAQWIASTIDRLGTEAAAVHFRGRASGAWTANDREHHAAFRSLCNLLEGGAQ